jgi:hypothetical protein
VLQRSHVGVCRQLGLWTADFEGATVLKLSDAGPQNDHDGHELEASYAAVSPCAHHRY